MRKITKFLPAVLLTMLVLPSLAFVVAGDPWFVLVNQKLGFKMEFPKEPEATTQNVPSAIGPLTMQIFMLEPDPSATEDNLVYGAIYAEYPDSVITSDNKELLDQFFRGSVDGAVSNVKGKLLSEKTIELKGFPGREIRVDFQNGVAIIRLRMYLVHNRMYILQTIATPDKDANKASERFMNSFQLLKL